MHAFHRNSLLNGLLLPCITTCVCFHVSEARSAERIESARTNASFKVSSLIQTIHGGIQIPAIIISTEAHQFSFIRPNGWFAQTDASQKSIRLISQKNSSFAVLQWRENPGHAPTELTSEILRQEIEGRYPDRKIAGEFPASALGTIGLGFEMKWSPRNVPHVSRLAIVAFPGGRLECEFTAAAGDAKEVFETLNQLLLSLRRTPPGSKLQIPSVTPE